MCFPCIYSKILYVTFWTYGVGTVSQTGSWEVPSEFIGFLLGLLRQRIPWSLPFSILFLSHPVLNTTHNLGVFWYSLLLLEESRLLPPLEMAILDAFFFPPTPRFWLFKSKKRRHERVCFSKYGFLNQTTILMWVFFLYVPRSNPWIFCPEIFPPNSKGITKRLEGI